MSSFIAPANWESVGASPEIVVNINGLSEEAVLDVVTLEDFKRMGGDLAAELTGVRLKRSGSQAFGVPEYPLAEGSYILRLRNQPGGPVIGVSGINVKTELDRWPQYFERMLAGRQERRAKQLPRRLKENQSPLFTITTTVYNTEPLFFEELAHLVASQTFTSYEWLVLDNGSSRRETIEVIERATTANPCIRSFRVEENRHIVGGNRYLLERARGEYVVPIDSDDILYADALEVMARRCLSEDALDIYYSDEQKVTQSGRPAELIWRSDWSGLFAMSTCPAAHLMAFRRDLALASGVYTADYARGSHDWDTMLRLVDNGARTGHIAEVLYGWRMHPESSALNEGSKGYLLSSQQQVVNKSLERRGLNGRFVLEHAKERTLGYYHCERRQIEPRPLAVDFILRPQLPGQQKNLRSNLAKLKYPDIKVRIIAVGSNASWGLYDQLRAGFRKPTWIHVEDDETLGKVASQIPDGVYAKAIIDCGNRLTNASWLWDVLGTFELDNETGIVTGPIFGDQRQIESIGYVAGLDGFFGTPRPGKPPEEAYGAIAFLRRHVTAAHSGFMAVKAGVVDRCGDLISIDSEDALFGIEFGLRCAAQGIKTAYTPRMEAVRNEPLMRPIGCSNPALRNQIAGQYAKGELVDTRYSRYLVQESARYGEIAISSDG